MDLLLAELLLQYISAADEGDDVPINLGGSARNNCDALNQHTTTRGREERKLATLQIGHLVSRTNGKKIWSSFKKVLSLVKEKHYLEQK